MLRADLDKKVAEAMDHLFKSQDVLEGVEDVLMEDHGRLKEITVDNVLCFSRAIESALDAGRTLEK